jgi:hypothetical protein
MEQVLNAKIRNQAFARFMIFFLISTSMVVLAVYFDFRVPVKENNILRAQVDNYENELYQQKAFVELSASTINNIDSLNKQGEFNPLLSRLVEKQLDTLRTYQYSGKVLFAATNEITFNVLFEHFKLKTKSIQLQDSANRVAILQKELVDTKGKLEDLQKNLDGYRNAGNIRIEN